MTLHRSLYFAFVTGLDYERRCSISGKDVFFGKNIRRKKKGKTETLCFMICFFTCLKSFTSYTSSTAQGGGGSFKNKKPIGEVACCVSQMAEHRH